MQEFIDKKGPVNLMILTYESQCRRIDLYFRAKYPYLNTMIYKINDYEYNIWVMDEIDNFAAISKDFKGNIRYVTVPIELVEEEPCIYEKEINGISDDKIPSNFEGFPFSLNGLFNHISCIHPDLDVSKIDDDNKNNACEVVLTGTVALDKKVRLQRTLDQLKAPYSFVVSDGGKEKEIITLADEVINLVPAKFKNRLNCHFVERDEELWFDNVESIYNGSFNKDDLYFFDPGKTCCLVNFSVFINANLRNHLLLYDVIYCILPLAQNMEFFLSDQKITKKEILYLLESGRLKILNLQPESRLDYGFLNEAFQTNETSVVSRRALSALCAMDLVEINKSYIFNDYELKGHLLPLLTAFSRIMNKPMEIIANFFLWPKYALRSGFKILNDSGPMGIPGYGVNQTIIEGIPLQSKSEIEFDFSINSSPVHLAHALDATYFPFFEKDGNYTDEPYARIMGKLLNFYKSYNYMCLNELNDLEISRENGNPSIQLISIFDLDDYIPIEDFEKEISSSVIREGMESLFAELSALDEHNRDLRILEYNKAVTKKLKKKGLFAHTLNLGEDLAGIFIPLLGTGKKLFEWGIAKSMDKFPAIQEVSEYIEDKTLPKEEKKRNISLLTQINRVAKLKQ